MAIIRYRPRPFFTSTLHPFRELDELTNRLRGMFEDETTSSRWDEFTPAVNVEETPEKLILTAELPGLTESDVEIELENNVLSISGQKVQEREEKEGHRFHLWERRTGSFQRSFTLPGTVRPEEISAEFRNGILEIHMPKMEEAKGRKIEIKTNAS
jgi:HSP20 family protein